MVAIIKLSVSQLCLLLILAAPQNGPRSVRLGSSSDRVPADKSHQSVMDFTLGRINPSNRDYGQSVEEIRKAVVNETISRGYFWSNLAALGLVAIFLCVILHQHDLQKRRVSIAAEWLTQYHNALVRANDQIVQATKRNHELMGALSNALDTEPAKEPTIGTAAREAGSGPRKRAYTTGQTVTTAPAKPTAAQDSTATGSAVADSSLAASGSGKISNVVGEPEVCAQEIDIVRRLNALQQQLSIYKEREKQLLRRVNDAELNLQKEQQKNRNLKGA